MKKILKFEFERMVNSKTFLISAIATSLIIIADVISWIVLYKQGYDIDTSAIYKWLGVNRGVSAGVYFFTSLPLLTSFAYSWSVSYDRSSGYITQIISRISRKKYFTAKFLVVFISGGMIFSGALVLDYMLLSTFSPAYLPTPGDMASGMNSLTFCSEIFYKNPSLFMLIWYGIAFLWGGAMSSIGLAAGMFIKKYIVSSIVPFLIFTAQQLIGAYIMQKYMITIKEIGVELIWTDMLYSSTSFICLPEYIWFSITSITITSIIIYALRGRKYECL